MYKQSTYTYTLLAGIGFLPFDCRENNGEIQQWMKEHNYTDYSKLEQYYETT